MLSAEGVLSPKDFLSMVGGLDGHRGTITLHTKKAQRLTAHTALQTRASQFTATCTCAFEWQHGQGDQHEDNSHPTSKINTATGNSAGQGSATQAPPGRRPCHQLDQGFRHRCPCGCLGHQLTQQEGASGQRDVVRQQVLQEEGEEVAIEVAVKHLQATEQ